MTPNLPEDAEDFDPEAELAALRVLKAKVYHAVRLATIGVGIVIIGTAVGFAAAGYGIHKANQAAEDAKAATEQTENEREQRISAFSQTIDTFCDTNNRQDRVLAGLLQQSLNVQPFGSGIDETLLTRFQLRVVSAIAAIQHASEAGPPTDLENAFNLQIRKLKDRTPCQLLVQLYLSGQPIPGPRDLKMIERHPEDVLGDE